MDAFPMLRKDNLFGALVYYGMEIGGKAVGDRKLTACRRCSQRFPNERVPRYDSSALW